jgi:4-hydroxythreonine-4-phosphate dehydrogenase
MSRKRTPVIAVTVGEPAGIGPEIVAKFFAHFRPRRSSAVIIGASSVMEPFLSWLSPHVTAVGTQDELATAVAAGDRLLFMDTGCKDRYPVGRDSRGGGRHAVEALDLACRLGRAGAIQGLATAPISKKSLDLAGCKFAGHTEMLARRFKSPDCQMMMVFHKLRVVTLTRHIAVRRVSRALTTDRIVTALAVVNRALKNQFGVARPHLGVAGLNPHAGESGLLGREEIDVIEPALKRLRRKGIRVTGPLPGDVLFQHAGDGTFDALVSMYHDQGLIPFKMLAKRRGVNVTVGLPIVRTSVDHGAAYDIAGKGLASFTSLQQAYELAEKLIRRRIMPTK